MTRSETIKELREYFNIRELVCPHTYKSFGEKSWQFFDRDFLEALLILRRDVLKTEMYVNNWFKPHDGETFSQRGFRCNICQLTKDKTVKGLIYLTAHANGAAIDAIVKGMSAEQARQLIKDNAYLFPMKVRIERGVIWLHFDVYDDPNSSLKVTEFNG